MNLQYVDLSGPQTIINIDEACSVLREALVGAESLDIDLTGVNEADLAFAQLIIATHKSAAAKGKVLRWRVAAGGPVVTMLARAGLDTFNLLDTAEGGPDDQDDSQCRRLGQHASDGEADLEWGGL